MKRMSPEVSTEDADALWIWGRCSGSDLVRWAEARLAGGSEVSGPVVELASLPRSSSRGEVDEVWARVRAAADLPVPDRAQAGRRLAWMVARDIGAGLLPPIVGARELWALGQSEPELRDELAHFGGAASEWDDSPAHRSEYESMIRTFATELLTAGR